MCNKSRACTLHIGPLLLRGKLNDIHNGYEPFPLPLFVKLIRKRSEKFGTLLNSYRNMHPTSSMFLY